MSPFHTLSSREARHVALLVSSWQECILFFVATLLVCILYLLALTLLPSYRVRYRYLIGSTLMLGMLYVLIPVVTSQDVFLYIGYARMLAIYHLNPLTTPPTAIAADPIYAYIFVVGPTLDLCLTWILVIRPAMAASAMRLHHSATIHPAAASGGVEYAHGLDTDALAAHGTVAAGWSSLPVPTGSSRPGFCLEPVITYGSRRQRPL